VIWLENTDYPKAIGDPNLSYLASKGITLSNYYAVTHPSQPNYMASVGGDTFGLGDDNFHCLPSNISSIVDLLEDKGISWGEYQEDMPYSGFGGFAWTNQQNGANDYVRKHNPLVLYDSVTKNTQRLACLKNLTMFYNDLNANQLPQWMFITPNMTSDGHDTSVTTAGAWTRAFLEPLMNNPNFMNNTLILITWDENHTYPIKNKVLGILLGDAVPGDLVGSTDSNIYTHYSELATVEANWDLHTLGRYDVGANVFSLVAEKTGDTLRNWTGSPSFDEIYFNSSYAGPLNSAPGSWPEPNTLAVVNGRSVLPNILETWSSFSDETYYGTSVEIADEQHPPVLVAMAQATAATAGTVASSAAKSAALFNQPKKSSFFSIICWFAYSTLGWRDFD
jgi:acid phosphatase